MTAMRLLMCSFDYFGERVGPLAVQIDRLVPLDQPLEVDLGLQQILQPVLLLVAEHVLADLPAQRVVGEERFEDVDRLEATGFVVRRLIDGFAHSSSPVHTKSWMMLGSRRSPQPPRGCPSVSGCVTSI